MADMTPEQQREMLELAALAAGLSVRCGKGHQSDMLFRDVATPNGVVTGVEWNPLHDDGDALRLAVKLRIDIRHDPLGTVVHAYWGCEVHEVADYAHGDDAAVRLAITRCAAEIGRRMKEQQG